MAWAPSSPWANPDLLQLLLEGGSVAAPCLQVPYQMAGEGGVGGGTGHFISMPFPQ